MRTRIPWLLLPSRHPHKFSAISAVELFLISNAKFDIHYVDAGGEEISAEAALKSKAQ